MMSVAPKRSDARISLETVASNDQEENPRKTPAPPLVVSTPSIGRRNKAYVAAGSPNMFNPDPPLAGLPFTPTPAEPVTLWCKELPPVYGAVRTAFSYARLLFP